MSVPAKSDELAGETARGRLRPLYIPRIEAMTLKQAVHAFHDEFGLSADTIRRLVKDYRLANQTMPGAPLRISAPGLAMVLDGDVEALQILRSDNRDHEDVQRYFKRLGIPLDPSAP